jgi:WD40 repeat protein
MSPDDAADDDSFAELLAACYDAIAAGSDPDPEATPVQGLRGRLDRGVACLRRLRQWGTAPTTADTGSAVPAEPEALPWRTLGRFELRRELGRGAFGVVYLAHDPALGRDVALKVPRPEVAVTPGLAERFRREARAAAALDHPNLVPIHEVGAVGPVAYLVSAYCPGTNLAEWLKRRDEPVPVADAARLVATLARAVGHAHERGVLHRDLKPANVLLTDDPGPPPALTPRVTDFGLARLLDADPEAGAAPGTRTGAVVGTPCYMAPEQAAGRGKEVGPAADLYALGAILYELLAGRPPFRGESDLDTLLLVQAEEPVPPGRLRQRLPRDLEAVCLKCLEKEPRRRYASAAALADDLERFLRGEPTVARPVGRAGRGWRWCRRNPGWAAMLATVAGLLLLIAVGSSLMTWRLNQALRVSEEERWVTLVAQARAVSRSRERGQRLDGLAAIRQAQRLPVPPGHSVAELRNEAIACLVLPDVEPAGDWWDGAPTGTETFALDAAFDRYARVDKGGNISVRRVADDTEILAIPSREGRGGLAWGGGLSFSPDGRFLLSRRDPGGRAKVYRLDGSAAEVVLEDATGPQTAAFAFSPDSRFFAVGHVGDGSVAVYDLQSARPDREGRRLRRVDLRPFRLAFRPGQPPGQTHLAVAGLNVVRVIDVEGGKTLFPDLSPPAGTQVDCIAWHPDGRTLATTCNDRRIRLWDVATGKMRLPPLPDHHTNGVEAAFSPAGDCLLSNDWSYTLRLWDPRTGRQLLQMPSTATVFSRDGSLLAEWSGSRVRLLRVAARRPLRALAPSGDASEGVWSGARISADGRLLFLTRTDALAILDWATGEELTSIRPMCGVLGIDSRGGLLTSGPDGLFRWPVRAEPEAGRLHVGPPEALYGAPLAESGGCGAGGGVLAIPRFQVGEETGALVLHQPENRRVLLGPREDVRRCAVSPDGRWVATGNWTDTRGVGATVWDSKSGQAEKDLPVGELCQVGFSPDGRWLLTTGGGFRLWKVGTWEEGPSLPQPDTRGPAHFAFAPDGRTLALFAGPSQVWLANADSGAEIARLTVPEQTHLTPTCFSPDGSQLVAIGNESNLLYIWDLRALRAELKELGLDWDGDDYPPAVQAAPAPLEVRVLGADDLRSPRALNDEAWQLVTGPAEQRDPARALQLIQKAVKHEPVEATLWNTLGVVLYRNGQYKEAVAALEKSLASGNQFPAFDLFFLAMCHAQLGDAAKAKDYYEKAVKWVEAQKNLPAQYAEPLKVFRAEAAETVLRAP